MVMNFIRKLMYGRYGSDQLSFFLLVVYVVLILLSGLPHLEALSWLALAVLSGTVLLIIVTRKKSHSM